MRINKEILHNIAVETVDTRVRANRAILSAYLTGSLLDEEPLLGGATDIDLVFIHDDQPLSEREIVPLTDAVHLDILHHRRELYRQPRKLRQHPWLGPTLFRGQPLYDPQHFLDFIQASVRSQFDLPENILRRARSQAEKARQLWFKFYSGETAFSPQGIRDYLQAIELIANAIASLNGPPLPERRLLDGLLARTEMIQQPGLYNGLVGLLGGKNVSLELLRSWLDTWRSSLESLSQETIPVEITSARLGYYFMGMETLIAGERPQDALWPLLNTWTQAVIHGYEADAWQQAMNSLGFSEIEMPRKVEALDAYLDRVEEVLESWGQQYGI